MFGILQDITNKTKENLLPYNCLHFSFFFKPVCLPVCTSKSSSEKYTLSSVGFYMLELYLKLPYREVPVLAEIERHIPPCLCH